MLVIENYYFVTSKKEFYLYSLWMMTLVAPSNKEFRKTRWKIHILTHSTQMFYSLRFNKFEQESSKENGLNLDNLIIYIIWRIYNLASSYDQLTFEIWSVERMKCSLLLSILISNSKVSTWKCILGMTIIKRIDGKKNCFLINNKIMY